MENNLKITVFKADHVQTCDLVISFTGIHTRETLTCTHKTICWQMLTIIQLTTQKMDKTLMPPLEDLKHYGNKRLQLK